jgi:hypothetical protein
MKALPKTFCVWAFLPFAILIVGFCAWSLAEGAQQDDIQWFVKSESNEGAVLGYLRPVLKSAGKAGRINFRAYCPPGQNEPVVFPKVYVLPPPRNTFGLAAVRGMFRNAKNISVIEDTKGIIRVTIGRVSTSILRTPMPKLALDPVSQYNDRIAISDIVWSDEVQSAMSNLKIRTPNRPFSIGIIQPDEQLPHLPAEMSNVTMDEALDKVAIAFHSIVLYGACVKPHLYEVTATAG